MGMRKGLLIIMFVLVYVAGAMGQTPMDMLLGADAPGTTYWTWNGAYKGTLGALSGGDLNFNTVGPPGNSVVIATLPGGTTGKSDDRYYEVTITTLGNNQSIGITNSLSMNLNTWMGADTHGYGYYSNGAAPGTWLAGALDFTPPPTTLFNSGDVIGILYKGSTNEIKMYVKQGGVTTLEATFTVAAGPYWPAMSSNGGNSTANFGASAWQLSGAPFGGVGWEN